MRHMITVVGTILCIFALYLLSPVYAAKNMPEVELVEAAQGNVYQKVTATGTIIAPNTARVTAPQAIRVIRCAVKPGQEVEEGQVLLIAEVYDQGIDEQLIGELRGALNSVNRQDKTVEKIISELLQQNHSVSGTLSGRQIVIKSPISGSVTELPLQEGDDAPAGTLCAGITDLQNLSVELEIPESNAEKVEEGMVCNISGEAFSKTYTGKIRAVSPVAQTVGAITGSGTTVVSAQADIRRPAGLRPGYSARVTIFTDMHRGAVLLPYEALTQDEEGKESVFVFRQGTLEKRTVTTGLEQSETVEILSGITPGEQVVLSPEATLKNGERVKEKTHENS